MSNELVLSVETMQRNLSLGLRDPEEISMRFKYCYYY
jgi:hypothetical protein